MIFMRMGELISGVGVGVLGRWHTVFNISLYFVKSFLYMYVEHLCK